MSDAVKIRFVHPFDISETLEARVGRDSEPKELIAKLIDHKFLERSERAAVYKLSTEDGRQLNDGMSITRQGVSSGDTLHVHHAVSGADERRPG